MQGTLPFLGAARTLLGRRCLGACLQRSATLLTADRRVTPLFEPALRGSVRFHRSNVLEAF